MTRNTTLDTTHQNTVFLCYRRGDAVAALAAHAIYEHLSNRNCDVFMDNRSLGQGEFGPIILREIESRDHFLIMLTKSTLERCDDPLDWVRREIETAIATKRNIVPIMLEGFQLESGVQLKGGLLATLANYNGLSFSTNYFVEGMEALWNKFLNKDSKSSTPSKKHPIVITPQELAEATYDPNNFAPKGMLFAIDLASFNNSWSEYTWFMASGAPPHGNVWHALRNGLLEVGLSFRVRQVHGHKWNRGLVWCIYLNNMGMAPKDCGQMEVESELIFTQQRKQLSDVLRSLNLI